MDIIGGMAALALLVFALLMTRRDLRDAFAGWAASRINNFVRQTADE